MTTHRSIPAADLAALCRETVQRGGSFRFISRGHSMRPAIEDGDLVMLGAVGPEGWRLGQVALARTPVGPVLHRIIAMGETGDGAWFDLRGDAERGPHQRVAAEDLIAKIVSPQRSTPAHRPPLAARLRRLVQQILGRSSPSA